MDKAERQGDEEVQRPVKEIEEPRDLLGLSNQMFEAGKFGECLVILEAAKAGGLPGQQLDTQKLIVHMHLYAERKDWWKVLQLEKGAPEPDIRASYKKFAQQVHPDKCACFGAKHAFQILGEAVSMVLGAAEGGFVKQATENEQYAWWDKWDVSPTSAKRKRKREQEAAPQDEAEILNQRLCPIEELKQEVVRLQAAVLRPQKGCAEEKLTAAQRQQRVRAARAILNERLSYAENAPKQTGGFL